MKYIVLLIYFAFWSQVLQAAECSVLPYTKAAIKDFKNTGSTDGYLWIWGQIQDKSCSLKNLGMSSKEFDEISKSYKKSKLAWVSFHEDNTDAAEGALRELSELYPNDLKIQSSSSKILKAVKQRWANLTKKIDSESGCQTKDMRPELPPVWDQGDTGWCYAHAIAAAITYELKQEVSVADIVVQNLSEENVKRWQKETPAMSMFPAPTVEDIKNKSITDEAIAGGYFEILIPTLQQTGVCSATAVGNAGNTELASSPNVLKQLEKDFYKLSVGNDPSLWKKYQELFKNINYQNFKSIALRSQPNNIVRELTKAACKNRIALEGKNELNFNLYKNENRLKKIDIIQKQLLSNHPVVIDSGAHAMLVVGQKFDKTSQKCRLIIRNSYGRKPNKDKETNYKGGVEKSYSDGNFEVVATEFANELGKMATLAPNKSRSTSESPRTARGKR